MDITSTKHTYPHVALAGLAAVTYPSRPAYNDTVKPLLKTIKKKNMRKHLETFTAFHTRYYKSDYGVQSATWLLDQVNQTIVASGADKHGATVSKFPHPWGQFSIIARIPGKSNKTVVV
ncbi:leucyl aminopeptidase, partial [Lasallia pustulata]